MSGRGFLAAAASLCLLAVIGGCEDEPDEFALVGGTDWALLPFDREVSFAVDSVVYDPAVGGTDRDSSRSLWHVSPLDSSEIERVHEYAATRDGRRLGGGVWSWTRVQRQTVHTLDGISLVGLIAPFSPGTVWDPLVYADPSTVLDVAGEPVVPFKRWAGRIDSVGTYVMPDDTPIEAVWVTLADDENLLELREFYEIYGAGEGLLERHVRILDTQNTNSQLSWAEKAERGFEVHLKRL